MKAQYPRINFKDFHVKLLLFRFCLLLLHYQNQFCVKKSNNKKQLLISSIILQILNRVLFNPFYPTALKGCRGIVFTHGVRRGGRSGGRREIVCPGCISETVRCRKFILGRDIGWGV